MTFELVVSEPGGSSSAQTTVTINPVNEPPTAVDDPNITVAEDSGQTTIQVLSNDSDPDGDRITITSINTAGTQGSVVNGIADVTFTPAADFTGTTTFTYTISDGNGETATATVTVNVSGQNDPPVAADDQATVRESGQITIEILNNDVDRDGDVLSVGQLDTQGTLGTVQISNSVLYTAPAGFTGIDTFRYTASDGFSTSNFATVSVLVNDVSIVFDEQAYGVNSAGRITISDISTLAPTFTINVASTSSPDGIPITMEAVSGLPGVFRGVTQVSFSDQVPQSDPATSTLRVSVGDIITATYTTSDSVTRTATATIIQDPLQAVGALIDTTRRISGTIGDTDGDILDNAWEQGPDGLVIPVTVDNNGDNVVDRIVEFVQPCDPACPSPATKDLYVELDYMMGHRPDPNALEQLRQAFAANQINLHIQLDDEISDFQIATPFPGTDTNPGFNQLKERWFGTEVERNNPDAAHLLTGKRQAFHYGLIAHLREGAERSSGIAENPGNDFMVTLGSFRDGVGTPDQQAATIMHELGHNLNLDHGGDDDVNCKPNYLSVMSYSKQFANFDSNRVIDFSKGTLPPLDENALAEFAGIGAPNTAEQSVVYGTPSGVKTAPANNSPIDWNGDGTITPATATPNTVQADINNLGILGCTTALGETPFTILDDHNDWANLSPDFKSPSTFYDGLVQLNLPDEQSFSMDAQINTISFATAFLSGMTQDQFANPGDQTSLLDQLAQANSAIQNYENTLSVAELLDARTILAQLSLAIDETVLDDDERTALGIIVNNLLASVEEELKRAATTATGPIALDDTVPAFTEDSTPQTILVLSNDIHLLDDTFSIISATNGLKGTVQVSATADSVVYAPNLNANGADEFTYIIQDTDGEQSTATARLTITSVNDDPTANADTLILAESEIFEIDALVNDFDVDGDHLEIISVTDGTKGTVTTSGDVVTYTRTPGQVGKDSFTYTISDGNGGTSTADITFEIDSDSDGITDEIDGLSQDQSNNPDNDDFADTRIGGTTSGSIITRADQTILVTELTNPDGVRLSTGETGTSPAEFSVCSGAATISLVASSALDVTCSSAKVKTTKGTADVEFNKDGQTRASANIPAGNGLFYDPVSFTISGLEDNIDTIDVTIDNQVIQVSAGQTIFVNNAPVANNDEYELDEDTNLMVSAFDGVLYNDSDTEDTLLQVALSTVTLPQHGILLINADGSFEYEPDTNFFGTDSFTYRATDGELQSNEATVTLTINQIDEPIPPADLFCDDMTIDELIASGSYNVIDNRDGHLGKNVRGTNGNDLILLSDEGDKANARNGNDCVIGGQGDDNIQGNRGDDQIFGQGGNNRIHGNQGNDYISAGDGNNKIWGGQGADTIIAGNGNNQIHGNQADDTITSRSGDDKIWGGQGADNINAGDGNNRIHGNQAGDAITSGEGNDWIHAGAGDDVVDAGAGNDKLFGAQGRDQLFGEDGDDNIHGGQGNDDIDGGEGTDRCDGGQGNNTFANCEDTKPKMNEESEEAEESEDQEEN
jgi:Ca2+-binding RTX toxin-like protein